MLIHSLKLIFIILSYLLDALFSSLDSSLDSLYLGLATGQLSYFLVKHLVHYVELEFLNTLNKLLSVIKGNGYLHLVVVPLLDELVVKLFCNRYLLLEVGAGASLNELVHLLSPEIL